MIVLQDNGQNKAEIGKGQDVYEGKESILLRQHMKHLQKSQGLAGGKSYPFSIS